MASVQISRTVRAKVRANLAASFNTAFAEACTEFGCVPAGDTPPSIDFSEPGRSYFEARLDLQQVLELQAPESWPALSVYVEGASDDSEQFGCTFAGRVQVALRGFLRFPDVDVTDNESWADAFEAAIVASLLVAEFDGINLLRGSQFMRGDLIWADNYFHQQIDATLTFEIDV